MCSSSSTCLSDANLDEMRGGGLHGNFYAGEGTGLDDAVAVEFFRSFQCSAVDDVRRLILNSGRACTSWLW
jgi:hypothetical protein